jgi:hypothetical protein
LPRAANVRHEHKWSAWRDVKLPDDKIVLPGAVTHATNLVEHRQGGALSKFGIDLTCLGRD